MASQIEVASVGCLAGTGNAAQGGIKKSTAHWTNPRLRDRCKGQLFKFQM